MANLAKYQQAIQLLNESGIPYLLVDLDWVNERATNQDIELTTDQALEILQGTLDNTYLFEKVNEEIDENIEYFLDDTNATN